MSVFKNQFSDTELSVAISELLVATSDSTDGLLDTSVTEVLHLLRQRIGMDAVFVSEFVDGQRVFRFIDNVSPQVQLEAGDAGPLEASYCQRVVDGRLPESVPDLAKLPGADALPAAPFPLGAHLSTPVVLDDGRVYGTLCCFSHEAKPELQQRDLTDLRACAKLVARKVDASLRKNEDTNWTLQPLDPRHRR
jgi:GAF domain-containing protein